MVSDGRLTDEQGIWMDLEGSSDGLIEIFSWKLARGTEEDHKATSCRKASIVATIWTKLLQNTSLGHYLWTVRFHFDDDDEDSDYDNGPNSSG
jgi:hypothetical protein